MPGPLMPGKPGAGASGKIHLNASDWVDAAMEVMAQGSESDVKIERLAVRLRSSKGSFYWHFRDRRQLLQAVLERWTKRATLDVQARLDHQERAPAQRLLRFLELPLRSGRAITMANLELTILNWARQDEEARAALALVDQQRTLHIAALIADLGLPVAEAERFAHEAYAMIRYVALRRDLPVDERFSLIRNLHHRILSAAGPGQPFFSR